MSTRWSVMIPTYNPTDHLREALASVLVARDRQSGPMQIEVVDDASPDVDPAELVRGWGFEDLAVFRRPSNGGLAACWNTCIERAGGELVHILHQDDLVFPDFYKQMSAAADRYPDAGMFFSRNAFIGGDVTSLSELEQAQSGPLEGWLERICSAQRVQCPAVVMRREIYAQTGGYNPALRFIIDWEMWIRVAAATAVVYVAEPLAAYRIHSGAETSRLKTSGAIVADLARGLREIRLVLAHAGRPDCVRLVIDYLWQVSGGVALEAQQFGRPDVACRELAKSIRGFGLRMRWRPLLSRLKWYLKLRVAALLPHRQLKPRV